MNDQEVKIIELLLAQSHFWLMIGIFCVLYIIRAITPIGKFLFCKKWQWLIPLINLGLSIGGVFVLGMTNATTLAMKVVVVVLITAITAYSYELTKPIFKKILSLLFKSVFKIDYDLFEKKDS